MCWWNWWIPPARPSAASSCWFRPSRPIKSGLLDENTPLGRLLLGHHAGQIVPYRAGDLKEVRILAVQAGDGSISSDAAAKRREAVQKAAAQSEITNQMIFSTASGSKWGDYDVDVDKLLKDEE